MCFKILPLFFNVIFQGLQPPYSYIWHHYAAFFANAWEGLDVSYLSYLFPR